MTFGPSRINPGEGIMTDQALVEALVPTFREELT
jgi:hypothetical protein